MKSDKEKMFGGFFRLFLAVFLGLFAMTGCTDKQDQNRPADRTTSGTVNLSERSTVQREAPPAKTEAEVPKKDFEGDADLVLSGKILDIYPSPLEKCLKDWVVTVFVKEVSKGSFEGEKFSFRICSPAIIGLKEGKEITVRAKRIEGGYEVDQFQWMPILKKKPVDREELEKIILELKRKGAYKEWFNRRGAASPYNAPRKRGG